MASIVVREPYRSIGSLVFGVKNIQRASSIFGNVDFNWSVEKLTNGLNFRVISVDTIFPFSSNVLVKGLIRNKLGKVFLIARLGTIKLLKLAKLP